MTNVYESDIYYPPSKENNHWVQVRRHQGHQPTILDCPIAIWDYNIIMRGADWGDQLITLYNGDRRTRKRLFITILTRSSSTHLLFTRTSSIAESRLSTFNLVHQILEHRIFREDMGRPQINPLIDRLHKSVGHMLEFRHNITRLHCKICSKKAQQLVAWQSNLQR